MKAGTPVLEVRGVETEFQVLLREAENLKVLDCFCGHGFAGTRPPPPWGGLCGNGFELKCNF